MKSPLMLGKLAMPVLALITVLTSAPCTSRAGERDLSLELTAFSVPVQGVTRIVKGAGPTGGDALLVSADAPNWAGTLTRVFTLPDETASVDLLGEMKLINVVGSGLSFTKARAMINFLDENGELAGGWQASTDRDGTQDWKSFFKNYRRPAGARYIKLELGLYNAVGQVSYSGLALTARDAAGNALVLGSAPAAEVRTDTSGWRAFVPGAEDVTRELVIDVPRILGETGPAGAHGFVVAKGDRFEFADGTPVRFWATNVGTSFNWPTAETGAMLVERLRRQGFNLVRLHHLDAGWAPEDIFATKRVSTRALDPDRLDRLQAQLARYRKAGIYYWADLLVTRKFTAADGVRDAEELGFGAKIAGFFNPRLIELQKEYARQLLTAPNPHTGLSMVQDPAMAFVALFNESSLFMSGSVGSYAQLPRSYVDEIGVLYASWREKHSLPPESRDVPALLRVRDEQVARFLMETQDAYYDEMRRYLREELGVKVPIYGSNFQECVGDLISNARLDAYDVHTYWDHPQGGWTPIDQTQNRRLAPTLRQANSVFRQIARHSVKDRPFFISEWQACWPNETHFEGPLLYTTMAALQGWDGLANFSFETETWSDHMTRTYEAGEKPNLAQALVTTALLFRRGDIAQLPPKEYPSGDLLAASPSLSVPPSALFNNSVQIVPGLADTAPAAKDSADGLLTTPDGAVTLDARNVFRVDVPRAAIVLGNLGGQPVDVGAVRFKSDTPYVQLSALALDHQPLASSRRILVQAIARAENTAQVYRAFRKGVSALGRGPILIEPVTGTVSWKAPEGASVSLTPLDWHGRRTGSEIPLPINAEGRVTIPLTLLTAGQALVEIKL